MTEEEVNALQDELAAAKAKVDELTGQLGERDAKLGEVQGELASLTESAAEKDEKLKAGETGEATLREEIGKE